MNMATTGTVQRDDAAECRQKFEAWIKDEFPNYIVSRVRDTYSGYCGDRWTAWQAAWKAARGV
jgi:hypothetical protein